MAQNKFNHIALVVVMILTALLYVQTVGFDFVYDDNDQVINNPWLQDISNLKNVFTSDAWAFASDAPPSHYYRPLMHATFIALSSVAGIKPWAFHLWSVILHALNAGLVFLLTLKLIETLRFSDRSPSIPGNGPGSQGMKTTSMAVFAALVFACHPINTEAVSWVSSVGEIYFTMGLLLATLIELSGPKSLWRSSAAAACFLFALLGKETAIIYVLMLCILRYAQGTKLRQSLTLFMPYVLAAGLYFFLRSTAITGGLGVNIFSLDWPSELLHALRNFALYHWKLILPINMSVVYDLEPLKSAFSIEFLLSVLTIMFVAGALLVARKHPYVLFSLGWIISPLILAMFSSIVSTGGFADRYLYCSSAGFACLLAYPLSLDWHSRHKKWLHAGIILLIFYLLVFAGWSFQRTQIWQNDLTLFSDAIEKSPNDFTAHNNLGNAYLLRNHYQEAVEAYTKAYQINPNNPQTLFNLGISYAQQGRIDQAMPFFRQFIERAPANFEVHKQRLKQQFPMLRE